MAGEWREVALEDVAREITVGHVGPMASEYVSRGIPFLRSQNVDFLRINADDIKYITPEFHERLRKSALSPGDVVIVRTGKPGTCAVIPPWLPTANCSDLVIVRCRDELDARFLSYYVNSIASQHVAAHLVGAVQQHFNVGSARTMRLKLPAIEEQRAITHILGTLDDKIELNRRMNETLEAIARAIFKSWFVDFDPVRAKASGELPESICRRLGLTLDLLALFPDRLVDSELGEIPEGWEWSSVGEEVSIFGGGTPSTANPEFWNGEYAWVTPKDLSGASAKVLIGSERKITQAGVKKISSGQLPIGTVLLSSRAPIGYLSLSMIPVSINQGFIAMVCDKRLPNTYVLQWAIENLDAIKQRGSGTTFAEISKTNFRPMAVLVPGEHVLRPFHQHVMPLYEQITAKVRESETLGVVRDTLLPKLLSGKLRVPVAVVEAEATA